MKNNNFPDKRFIKSMIIAFVIFAIIIIIGVIISQKKPTVKPEEIKPVTNVISMIIYTEPFKEHYSILT